MTRSQKCLQRHRETYLPDTTCGATRGRAPRLFETCRQNQLLPFQHGSKSGSLAAMPKTRAVRVAKKATDHLDQCALPIAKSVLTEGGSDRLNHVLERTA